MIRFIRDNALQFAFIAATAIACAVCLCGCAYKGGKIIDGTNLAIGLRVPGTEWNISVLDYIGGVRVAGNDATSIMVTNEVWETNSYFGCVAVNRHTRLSAAIEPVVDAPVTNDTEFAKEERREP